MREQLLGYLLDALEPDERQRVEDALQRDSELQRELELLDESLEPLRAADGEVGVPADLADRTCRLVSARTPSVAEGCASGRSHARPSEPVREAGSDVGLGSRRFADMAVAASVALAAALLLFPAIQHSRESARLAGCQDKLRSIGLALAQYAQQNHDYLPSISPGSTAGIYAVRLRETGFFGDTGWNWCPGSVRNEVARRSHVPTWDELNSARGAALAYLLQTMGGDFGYTLHFVKNGVYRCTKRQSRPTYAVMADAPGLGRAGLSSANHGQGQNVLYEDGHIRHLHACKAQGCPDHIFLNDLGVVAAGSHANDAVIGHSAAQPFSQSVSSE